MNNYWLKSLIPTLIPVLYLYVMVGGRVGKFFGALIIAIIVGYILGTTFYLIFPPFWATVPLIATILLSSYLFLNKNPSEGYAFYGIVGSVVGGSIIGGNIRNNLRIHKSNKS